jgi:hypothetical protein
MARQNTNDMDEATTLTTTTDVATEPDKGRCAPARGSAPIWYTESEMYHWLILREYAPNIARELSKDYARHLQDAFDKGFDIGKRQAQRRCAPAPGSEIRDRLNKVTVRIGGATHVTDPERIRYTLCGRRWWFECVIGTDHYCEACQSALARIIRTNTQAEPRPGVDTFGQKA